jgi:Na+/proline symporter
MSAFLLSEAAGLGAAFGTLACFFLATVFFAAFNLTKKYDDDVYMSARNSQSALALTLSYFASGAGAWILFAVPEATILGGPIALLGYCLACVLPLFIMAWMGPRLRAKLPRGITFFEYVQGRYGPLVNAYVVLSSLFYMFLFLSAEFTSVGQSVDLLCGTIPTGTLQGPGLATVVGTSLVTLFYTSYGGLPISLMTDRVQGVGMIITCVLVTIAGCVMALFPAPSADTGVNNTAFDQMTTAHANWEMATSFGVGQTQGNAWSMAIVLVIAVTCANMLHTGYHQRIWAAQNDVAVRQGLFAAAAITVPFMLLFGFMGMVAFARYGFSLLGPPYLAFLSAFWLIQELSAGWQVLGVVLAVSMVASSCDTLQTGITALLHPVTDALLAKLGFPAGRSAKASLLLNFAVTAVINIPAIVMSTQNVSVLTLFVLADLLCATCIVPVVLGLWDRIHPHAALAGCAAGLLVVLITFGVGVDSEPGNFVVLVQPGGIYATTSLVAFILTPVCSGIATLLANIPFFLRGYTFEGYPEPPPATASSTDVNMTVKEPATSVA